MISASSLTGAAKLKGGKGSAARTAVVWAGTKLVGKIGAQTRKDTKEDYDQQAVDAGLGPPGKIFRVYGVYIGFKARRLSIKMKDQVTEVHTESMKVEIKDEIKDVNDPEMFLWDVDENKIVS